MTIFQDSKLYLPPRNGKTIPICDFRKFGPHGLEENEPMNAGKKYSSQYYPQYYIIAKTLRRGPIHK